jgi:CRP-like cAMP-binding protein
LKKFADHLVEKNCVKDTIILKEGEDADQIFIVRKGEFVVS